MRGRKTDLTLRTQGTVFELGRHRQVIVEFSPAQPDMIRIRAAGLKTRYSISGGDLYTLLVRRSVEAERREQRALRGQKRQRR